MEKSGTASSDLSAPEWDEVFKSLLYDIRRRKCVLLLGPEAAHLGGRPLREALREHLAKNHADDIAFFHERDNLFLFHNKAAKSEVQRSVSLFFEEAEPDLEVFGKLASLPFALTVSINPDHFYLHQFPKSDRPHFAFFNHIGQNNEEALDGWNRDQPLVYNLCGSFEEDVSLVLDYDDLFRLLRSAMGAPGLPQKVRRALGEARSFFFLGFSFDKWYTQLLLRLLCEDNSPMHVALNTQLGDGANQTFLLKQFNINFIGQGDAFLSELCRRWKEQQGESADEKPDKHLVLRLLAEGKTARALEILMKIVTAPEDKDMALMISNWYKTWENDKTAGVEDSRDLNVRYNRVVKNIQDLANNLPEES